MISKMKRSVNNRTLVRVFDVAILLCVVLLSSCIGGQGSDLLVKPSSEVDEIPTIVGGVDYIIDELSYPKEAKEENIEGRVLIQFVVNREGKVRDAQVVEGIGFGCDEEALRVIEKATFRPGKIKDELVDVQMMIPLQFKLK